jgi:hypothetical protein
MERNRQIEAARQLLNSLNAPLWAVSVMAWQEAGRQLLVVSVDPTYGQFLDIPKEFQGLEVVSQVRPVYSAHSIDRRG